MAEAPGRRVMQGLGPRVVTGLGLALGAVALVLAAPLFVLGLVVAGLAVLGMREYLRLALPGASLWEKAAALALAAALPLAALLGGHATAGALGLGLTLCATAAMAGPGQPQEIMDRLLRLGWGLLYVPGLLSSYLLLGGMEQGRLLILFVVVVVVMADSGAYFAGHLLGSRRLAPRLSPGKTLEGLAGGLALAGLAGGVFAHLFLADTPPLAGAGLGLVLAGFSVAGDLLESTLKRASGAKDSGSLLPGHGGLLDRVDGLLVAAPVLLLCRVLWW
ncbi:MAG: phosphatidate cytidylyltransferase [Desulfarculus sp.]|nr:phosphatidate cytidylyltransferase [Desulfarculus sp.]